MRRLRRALCACLAALALLPLGGMTPAPAAETAREALDARLAALMEAYALDEAHLAYAFRPAEGGAEITYNEDALMRCASVYKLPLNMWYYEQEAAGLLAPDTRIGGYSLDVCHEYSLLYSNNDLSEQMLHELGDYRRFKELAAVYAGADLETLDDEYFWDSVFSARMLLETLQYLYDGGETFAGCLDLMRQAQPGQYFRAGVTDWPVAQKYGHISDENGGLYVATAGIVYTPEPFLLVVLTENVAGATTCIGEFAAAFCDYAVAAQAEAERAAEAQRRAEAERAEAASLRGICLGFLLRLVGYLTPARGLPLVGSCQG